MKRLGLGKYTYKDIDTGKIHTVKGVEASDALRNLNKKLNKTVNYSFIGWKKR